MEKCRTHFLQNASPFPTHLIIRIVLVHYHCRMSGRLFGRGQGGLIDRFRDMTVFLLQEIHVRLAQGILRRVLGFRVKDLSDLPVDAPST